jgi:glycosyltransferase involved in cell wall biosynthesis
MSTLPRPIVYHLIPGDGPNALIESIALTSDLDVRVLTLYNIDHSVPKFCEKNGITIETLGFENKSTFKQLIRLMLFMSKNKPKLIFAHSFYPSAIVAIAKFFFPWVRFVSVRHHNKVHILSRNRKAILADKIIFLLTSHTVCVSNAVRETMIDQGARKSKLTVIYNGLSHPGIFYQHRQSRQVDGTFQLIALGRIDWQKNYEGMLKVMAALKTKGALFHLRILGSGNSEYLAHLKSIQFNLGLGNSVEWCGRKSNIYEYLEMADLFVHTAKDEACPLVLLESMMFGIPIVSSNLGGCRDVLSGLYEGCDPEDPDKFAEMILESLKNLNSVVKNAAEISTVVTERFSSTKMQAAYTALSLNLLLNSKVS